MPLTERDKVRLKEYRKENAAKLKAYRKSVRHSEAGILKYQVQRALYRAVRRGTVIRPKKCSKCGVRCKPQGHHEDYTKRFEVVWLCASCHRLRHVELERT
jgi:hypothetical protein